MIDYVDQAIGRIVGSRFKHAGTHAVIKGDWKIVREGGEKGAWYLYNLTQEKTELTDHAGRMPDKVKELAALWETRFKLPH